MSNSWLEERTGFNPFWRAIFQRHVPEGLSWWYTLGAACLTLLLLQSVTGILLAMNYVPSPERAYDSVSYITNVVPFGLIVRGIHHWGASAMVVLVILHLVSAFVLGAHKYPREATWLVGVLLLLVTMGFGFTGYLLPWDQKAYWATTVGTNMPGTAPLIGGWLVLLLRGGTELGAVALARFYAIHVLVLPATIGLLALVHLALVIFHGVSVPPALWHRGLRSRVDEVTAKDPAVAAALDPLQAGTKLTATQYHDRYKAFKSRGPSFWPEVIADDAKTSLFVFVLILGLTVISGVPTEPRADSTDTAYIPRPEWYFMFLFQMLKFFPGNLEWVGALVVPGAFVGVLFLAPFLSGGGERRPARRPVGAAFLAATMAGIAFLSVQAFQATPPSLVVEHGAVLTSQQLRGMQIVQQQGCRSCHTVDGEGDARKAPPLDGIGQRLTAADIHFFMERPKAYNPAASMTPLIPPLTHDDVENVTQYLLTLPADITVNKGEADVQRASK